MHPLTPEQLQQVLQQATGHLAAENAQLHVSNAALTVRLTAALAEIEELTKPDDAKHRAPEDTQE